MGTRKKEPVVVKKIKAYPILVKITKSETTPPIEGQILRVTAIGFQMEVSQTFFSVGDIYKVQFTLPLYQKTVTEDVKIVRTMDRFLDQKATQKGYLVEMHFLRLDPLHAKAIAEFEISINQKP